MKLQIKREVLDKIKRSANEMPGVLAQQSFGGQGFDTVDQKTSVFEVSERVQML